MKSLSIVLATAILTTACSKTVKEVSSKHEGKKENATTVQNSNEGIKEIERLLDSQAPNLALAELIGKTIEPENRNMAKNLILSLSAEETTAIINEVKKQNEGVRQAYLFNGQRYKSDKEFLKRSLVNPLNAKENVISIENQLKFSAFAYVKSKYLNEVISTYDKRATELSRELTQKILSDLAKDTNAVSSIENLFNSKDKDQFIEAVRKSKYVVEKIDELFRTSNLNEQEQYFITFSGVVAGGIYFELNKHGSFREFVAKTKRIIKDAVEISAKVKEAVALIDTLDKHLTETRTNMRDLSDGVQGMGRDIKEAFFEAKKDESIDKIRSRAMFEFLHQEVILGKKVSNPANASILSKQRSINANFQKTLDSAQKLTNNLNSIVSAADNMCKLFKIRPSKDMQKVMDKVNKAGQVISAVQTVTAGFAVAGPMGALAALGSGPVSSLLGGGDSNSAKLDEISKKLTIVIENQQKMMHMQVETMQMIKDLAVMIDQYHQEEMASLAELRDLGLIHLEFDKMQSNQEVRNCEALISFQLSSVWEKFDFSKESYSSIRQVSLNSTTFLSQIHGLSDVRRMVDSLDGNSFVDCQRGLVKAFGGTTQDENPIRAIFSSDENDNLFAFNRDVYSPLLDALKYYASTENFNAIPLHFPSQKLSDLDFKNSYVMASKTESVGQEIYELDNLISAKSLERYLTNLLILLPVIEMDKDVWKTSRTNIIDTYLNNARMGGAQNVRSSYLLTNALKLTQSAIAQETLLAGEPLMKNLYDNWMTKILAEGPCEDLSRSQPFATAMPLVCSIRQNGLLMKNLMNYSLVRMFRDNSVKYMDYAIAYDNENVKTMAKLALKDSTGTRVQMEEVNGEKVYFFMVSGALNKAVKVYLPKPADYKKDRVLYSENMLNLLEMQEAILEALAKVAPVKRDKTLAKYFLVN